MKPYLSVVVPLFNEKENISELHAKIEAVCRTLEKSYEIIFVDDGSTDGSQNIAKTLSPLVYIELRRNFGQTAAFDAGFKEAAGEIVVTMDGDLQNDPADIPLLLAAIDRGADVVSGWRYKRRDSFMKKFFSRTANVLRTVLLKDSIHDSGCSLKAFRAEALRDIDLYGEMHRFIPALLEVDGWIVQEVKVSHHKRKAGKTKYNWKRSIKGFSDMIYIWFWRSYASRPIHFFGGGGIFLITLGFGILLWMAYVKIFFDASLSDRIWPLMGVFLVMLGVQFFVFGLLADILTKNYYKVRGRMNYSVKKVTTK